MGGVLSTVSLSAFVLSKTGRGGEQGGSGGAKGGGGEGMKLLAPYKVSSSQSNSPDRERPSSPLLSQN